MSSTLQVAVAGALMAAQATWAAAAAAISAWLLLAGTPFWRDSISSGIYTNLGFMVGVPFLLSAASLALLVLQPLRQDAKRSASSNSSSSFSGFWAGLLPSR
jgi:hypothetical protein